MTKSISNLKLYFSHHKVLLLAIVASLVLHAILIIEFAFHLPQLDDDKQILEARLVNLQPPQPAAAVPGDQELPPPEQTKPENTAAESAPEAQTEPVPSPVSADDHVTEPSTPGTLSSASLNMAPLGAGTDYKNNDNVEQAEETGNDLDAEKQKILFTHVETEFEVKRGINTTAAGITKITFNIDKNGTYTIYSQTQAKGLASLFFGNLVQKSEGSITVAGLKPDFYSYQYGNDTKKLQSAHFNWKDGVLNLHSAKGDSSVQLPDGTQDFLSFMYQFMFNPPLNNMQITMTNGKKLRTYYYSFEGEETITTKLGELKTVHLLKSSTEDEKTEIWLATDYQYLPVKIRKTEKDGTVIEQLAVNLTTKD